MQNKKILYNKINKLIFKIKILKTKIIHKLLSIFIIFISFSWFSFANWECDSWCKIKDATPEIILKYIQNNRKVINNISKYSKKWKHFINVPTQWHLEWTKFSTYNSFSTGIWLRIYNSLFNWTKVKSGFQYFLSNIDWDVPYPIKRDLRLIDNQNEILNRLLTNITSNWYTIDNLDPKKLCEWVDDWWKCEKFIWNNIEDSIRNLIQNNSTINLIIRKELWFMWFKSIVGSDSYNELFLVDDNFKTELKKYYNKSTYESCAKCKWWSIYRVKKMKDKILLNDKAWKNWIQEWKDAWDLLIWVQDKDNEKEQKLEKSLLQEELSRQWVSSNNWKAVINSLKNFNWKKFGFSLWNNPITNSFRNFADAITRPFQSKTVNDFTKTIGSLKDAIPDKDIFSIDEINFSKKNLTNDDAVFQNINIAIKSNLWLIAKQNKSTDKLQARIIQLHINLIQTINMLEKIRPRTEKICNDQDYWNWICSYK